MKKIGLIVSTIVSLLAISSANANLIINGSFEDNDIAKNTWKWFDSSAVNGWSGSNIEIWDSFNGVTAVDGTQFAELNAHANKGAQFNLFQSFNTESGDWYQLSFNYRARSNENEAFQVSITSDNDTLFSQIIDDHVRNTWSFFTTSFRAISSSTVLSFTSITPHAGTVGNFLDAIVVTPANNGFTTRTTVSEPSTLAIAFLVIAGLLVHRFRTQRQVSNK